MGVETAIIIGLTVAKGAMDVAQAKREAKGVTAEAKQQAEARARDAVKRGSTAKTSFLSSGFEIEGTPELSIASILNAGQQDINTIGKNANTKSANIMSAARNKVYKDVLSMGMNSMMGSSGGPTAGGIQSTAIPGVSGSGGWSSTPYSGNNITWNARQ